MRLSPEGPEDTWLFRAKRLLALAQTGQHYAQGAYDIERYDEIAALAQAMMADLGQVPVQRIPDLIPKHIAGYATPGVDVRGAVIRDNRVLLVREKSDGKWALPGGFAEIGYSPGENVEKEIREEAGLNVRARHCYALIHKARHPYPSDIRDFYKMFFLCEDLDATDPAPGPEVSDAGFFAEDALPDLSLGRNLATDVLAAFAARRSGGCVTSFD